MDKETKQIIKDRKAEEREQNRVFRSRINNLFAKKFRYSLRFEENTVQDDGKAYINVDLTKVESPFSIYSYDRRLDQEIYDFIDNEVNYLRASIPIVINFDDGGRYSEEMKERIRKVVIRHYSLAYEDKRLEYRKNIRFGIGILGFGILVLLTYILLSLFVFKDNTVIEIICILSWVCVWEFVDRMFFSGHDRRVDIYNAGQLALAEVQFGAPVGKK